MYVCSYCITGSWKNLHVASWARQIYFQAEVGVTSSAWLMKPNGNSLLVFWHVCTQVVMLLLQQPHGVPVFYLCRRIGTSAWNKYNIITKEETGAVRKVSLLLLLLSLPHFLSPSLPFSPSSLPLFLSSLSLSLSLCLSLSLSLSISCFCCNADHMDVQEVCGLPQLSCIC